MFLIVVLLGLVFGKIEQKPFVCSPLPHAKYPSFCKVGQFAECNKIVLVGEESCEKVHPCTDTFPATTSYWRCASQWWLTNTGASSCPAGSVQVGWDDSKCWKGVWYHRVCQVRWNCQQKCGSKRLGCVNDYKKCADENNVCKCNGRVRYGTKGIYAYTHTDSTIGCNNEVLGDPAPGEKKHCDCLSYGQGNAEEEAFVEMQVATDFEEVEAPQAMLGLILHILFVLNVVIGVVCVYKYCRRKQDVEFTQILLEE